jgi:hypothetical protein
VDWLAWEYDIFKVNSAMYQIFDVQLCIVFGFVDGLAWEYDIFKVNSAMYQIFDARAI